MNIETPSEFKAIFRNMGLNFGDGATNKEDFVLHALIGVDQIEAKIIAKFIERVLVSYNSEDIKSWWRAECITVYFDDGRELVDFLTIMKNILKRSPYV
jgi:hypothetical protein